MLGELDKANLKIFGAYFTIKLEEPAENIWYRLKTA